MKKLLTILVVLVLILASAYFVRVPDTDVRQSLSDHLVAKKGWTKADADRTSNSLTLKDRIVGYDLQDSAGGTVYSTVYKQWISRGDLKPLPYIPEPTVKPAKDTAVASDRTPATK